MTLPTGTYGRIAPRSGLTVHNKVTVMAGVIDPDYRGDIMVILYNYGSELFSITPRQKIAQFVLEKFETPHIDLATSLEFTARGARDLVVPAIKYWNK